MYRLATIGLLALGYSTVSLSSYVPRELHTNSQTRARLEEAVRLCSRTGKRIAPSAPTFDVGDASLAFSFRIEARSVL